MPSLSFYGIRFEPKVGLFPTVFFSREWPLGIFCCQEVLKESRGIKLSEFLSVISRTNTYPFSTFLASLRLYFPKQFLLAPHLLQGRHSTVHTAWAAPGTLAARSPLALSDSPYKARQVAERKDPRFSSKMTA